MQHNIIGFIAAIFNLATDSPHLKTLDDELTEARQRLVGQDTQTLQIGIGFITGHETITRFVETALPIIAKHRPAIVWLFAPDGEVKPHGMIIKALKGLEPPPKVFVQVGNITAAKEAVEDGADVLVCQGIDAGGHQFRRGTGIISFVPEAKQMLATLYADREIPVLAAGGIVNGKGIAAALALGMYDLSLFVFFLQITDGFFYRSRWSGYGHTGKLIPFTLYKVLYLAYQIHSLRLQRNQYIQISGSSKY